MNQIELKALRKVLCLSVSDAAKMLKVEERSYQRWEQGKRPIPAGIQEDIIDLADDLAGGVSQMMEQVLNLTQEHKGDDTPLIVFPIYNSDQEQELEGEQNSMPYQIANAIYYHVYMLCNGTGIGKCKLTAFDFDKYKAWLNEMGYADSRVFRAQFAAKRVEL